MEMYKRKMSKDKILKVNTDLLKISIKDETQYKNITTLEVCGMNNKDFLQCIEKLDNVENIIIHNASNVIVDETLVKIKNQSNIKSLILDNVKIPRLKLLDNMTNISMMSFNNIKDRRLYTFLKNYKNKSYIQYLTLENVELKEFNFNVIEKYICLKTININNVETNWENISSLFNLNFIEKINIHIKNSSIELIQSLVAELKGKKIPKYCELTIKINNSNNNFYNSIIFKKDGKVEGRINTSKIKEYAFLLKLYDELVIYIDANINFNQYLRQLSSIKKIRIIIPNCAMLTTRKAEYLNKNLNICTVNIFDFNERIYSDIQKHTYDINDYIRLRQYIDSYINNILIKSSKLERFLTLYYRLGKDVIYNKAYDLDGDAFRSGLIEKKCGSLGFTLLLKNLSACLGIKTNLILGKYNNKTIVWNQVELEHKWYNVDISNDSLLIRSRKGSKYCLLSNEDFQESHVFGVARFENCAKTYDSRVVNRYFKFGRIIDYRGRIIKIIKKIELLIKSNGIKRLTDGSTK